MYVEVRVHAEFDTRTVDVRESEVTSDAEAEVIMAAVPVTEGLFIFEVPGDNPDLEVVRASFVAALDHFARR